MAGHMPPLGKKVRTDYFRLFFSRFRIAAASGRSHAAARPLVKKESGRQETTPEKGGSWKHTTKRDCKL